MPIAFIATLPQCSIMAGGILFLAASAVYPGSVGGALLSPLRAITLSGWRVLFLHAWHSALESFGVHLMLVHILYGFLCLRP